MRGRSGGGRTVHTVTMRPHGNRIVSTAIHHPCITRSRGGVRKNSQLTELLRDGRLVNGEAECEARRAHDRMHMTSRRWLIGLSSLVAMLMIAGAVSFLRYARLHALQPTLVAVAPFDIFVPGLEPWRVRLAQALTAWLDSTPPLTAVSQDVVRERWHGQKQPEIAALDLARRASAGVGVYGRLDPFAVEVKNGGRMLKPNSLPVCDSGGRGGTLYYVMPFVEGESLRDRLDREPQLLVDDALQIAHEVAEALAYAHDHDVVHRDIKPENIMLSGGHAIVADFGIARAVSAAGGDKLTQTGLAIGTPAYMPPAQASGSGQVDRRSDIYSLACVLYETPAGQPPV